MWKGLRKHGLQNLVPVGNKMKRMSFKFRRCVLLIIAAIFVFVSVVYFVRYFIQEPKPLTETKILAYGKVILFAESHNDIGDFDFIPGNGFNMFIKNKWVNYEDHLNQREINKVGYILKTLGDVNCLAVRRRGGMIIFYPHYTYLRKIPPVVLYSLNDTNPNHHGSKEIRNGRPYFRIKSNWFYTKKLKPKIHFGW